MSIKLISLTGRECTAETEKDAAPFIELGYRRAVEATKEQTYTTEAGAHAARRALINKGVTVSLIAFDPSRNLYAFDAA